MEPQEGLLSSENQPPTINLREYFNQTPIEASGIKNMETDATDIIDQADLTSLNDPNNPDNPAVRIENLITLLETTIDSQKQPPPVEKKTAKQQTGEEEALVSFIKTARFWERRLRHRIGLGKKGRPSPERQRQAQAYREEFKRGVDAMIEMEDFITQEPDLSFEDLVEKIFDQQQDGKLIPKKDITNQQAVILLSNGLRYLLDHRLLQLAEDQFGTNSADEFCRFFIGKELIEPDKAKLEYQPDIGVVLFVSDQDLQQLYPPEESNPDGFYYWPAEKADGQKLNGQIMVVARPANSDQATLTETQTTVNHEKDHLLYFKYRRHCRKQLEARPEADSVARLRLQATPLASELLLSQQELAELAISMASEISAYQQEGAQQHLWANLSVKLEKVLPPTAREFWENKYGLETSDDFFSRPMDELSQRAMEIIYPIVRRNAFVEFYQTLSLVQKAKDRGVPARKISAALALTGIRKAKRLDLLEPVVNKQILRQFEPHGFYQTNTDGQIEIVPPYLGSFLFGLKQKQRVVCFWPTEISGVFTPKEEMEKNLRKLYDNHLPSIALDIPLTIEAFRQRYTADGSQEKSLPLSRELTSQEKAVIQTASGLSPSLNRRFYEEAVTQDNPFHPLFHFEFEPKSDHLARKAKLTATASNENMKSTFSFFIDCEEKKGQPGHLEPPSSNPHPVFFYPLVYFRMHYPEDEAIFRQIETEFWPQTHNLDSQTIEAVTNGQNIIEGQPSIILPIAFFRDYTEIKENQQSLEPAETKQRIQSAITKWQEAIKRLKVPVTKHQLLSDDGR